jgi:hypothetical protein
MKELRRLADFDLRSAEGPLVADQGRELSYLRLYSVLAAAGEGEKYFVKAQKLAAALARAAGTDEDQQIRSRLQAYAYYYDLCFHRLSAEERAFVEDEILAHINRLDSRGYLRSENFGGGHEHYANISALAGALAIYHERPKAREIAGVLETNMKEGFQPFFRHFAEEDGGFHMWWEYGRYYIFSQLEFSEIWRNATGEDLFAAGPWLGKTADFIIYGLRDDLTVWASGDNHSRRPGWKTVALLDKIAVEYSNGHAAALARRLEAGRRGWPGADELFFRLIWPERAEPRPLDELPAVRAFQRAGVFIFREGWAKDNVAALFKNTPVYLFNHSHRDANSFEIWYKGDLAIDSGHYDSYGSPHWLQYYTRSIAHNTVLIVDPAERFSRLWGAQLANDGGQRLSPANIAQPGNAGHLTEDRFRIGNNQWLADNADYSLVVGDATGAYSRQKCELFKRYFLWLKKVDNWPHPVIVVLDKVVSARPELEKRWLLHSINRPRVRGNVIEVQEGGGKLWNYIIQPLEARIEVVGGPGREFEVAGTNYPPGPSRHGERERSGAWRVELSAPGAEKETVFLNVLVPAEKRRKAGPDIAAIENGVRVGNWAVTYDGTLKITRTRK